MVFSTIIFLLRFLPITLALYYLAPPKLKNTVLFLCSLVFYCWGEVRFFPVMLALFLIYSYASSLFGDTLYLVPVFCNFLQISLCNKKLVYKRGCKLFVLLIRRTQLIYFVRKLCKPAFVGELYLIKLLWLDVKRKLLFSRAADFNSLLIT